MIIFDTETTGLLKPDIADIATQPHIIEVALLKLDSKYKEVSRYESLINPGIDLDEELHKKITGLTNADLAQCPSFLEVFDDVAEFFIGERKLIAHNLEFDLGMLRCELIRIGKECAFPFPPQQVCTVKSTMHIKGRRLKLTELYELKLEKKFKQKHRAMSDVLALAEVVRKLKL